MLCFPVCLFGWIVSCSWLRYSNTEYEICVIIYNKQVNLVPYNTLFFVFDNFLNKSLGLQKWKGGGDSTFYITVSPRDSIFWLPSEYTAGNPVQSMGKIRKQIVEHPSIGFTNRDVKIAKTQNLKSVHMTGLTAVVDKR